MRVLVDDLLPDERADIEAAMAAEEAGLGGLAGAALWHRTEEGRTSQLREALRCTAPGTLFRWTLGGNLSGKSRLGAMLDVVYASGALDPDVQAWAALNGVDLAATDIPPEPGEVWAVALSQGDSLRYVRPTVESYLPVGTLWRGRHQEGEAEARLPNGGRIRFRSVDQKRRAFQGAGVRRVHFDEEPDDYGVFDEAKMRIVAQGGHVHTTMTPLRGWTRLLHEFIREVRPDTALGHLTATDNPHVDPALVEAVLARSPAGQRAARLLGRVVALEGLVYPFDRDLHVIPARTIPREWPRYAGVDFGVRNPCCVLWLAHDRADDVLHVYRERYVANVPTEENADAARVANESERPEWVVADPSGKAERLTWLSHGVPTVRARSIPGSVRAGISAVTSRLAPDADGRPHLVVHDSCPRTIEEFEGYVWESSDDARRDLPEQPVKRGDHAMDAMRMVVARLDAGRMPGGRGDTEAGDE
jgi:phage terminase large subunit-like protein